MSEPSVSSIAIYQLRVVLCGVSPLVRRRLLVVSTTSIAELHEIPQSAFGWSGEHLHRFLIHGAACGIPHLGGIVFREDARGVPFPVSVCIVASASAMNTTSRAERHSSAMAECNRNETLRSTGAAWSAFSGSLDPSIISDETQGRQFPRLPRRPIRHFGAMR